MMHKNFVVGIKSVPSRRHSQRLPAPCSPRRYSMSLSLFLSLCLCHAKNTLLINQIVSSTSSSTLRIDEYIHVTGLRVCSLEWFLTFWYHSFVHIQF